MRSNSDVMAAAKHGLAVALTAFASVGIAAAIFVNTASAQPPTPGLSVQGQVTARQVRVHVDCGRGVGTLECQVEQQFELEAHGSDGVFRAFALDDLEVSFDGWTNREASLPAGRPVAVEVRYTVGRGGGWPVVVPPLNLRHPVVGESWRFYRARDSVEVVMPRGDGLRVEGEVVYEVRGVDGVTALVGTAPVRRWPFRSSSWNDVTLTLRHQSEPFANGGPVIMIGGQIRADALTETALLGIGYEVGLVEHLILSLWFETNLEAIGEALLLEVVSPGLFIVPSVAAGAGLVVTQLGPRGVDAAMRIRLSLSTWALGFVADFDYYPSTESWDIGLAGRVGI